MPRQAGGLPSCLQAPHLKTGLLGGLVFPVATLEEWSSTGLQGSLNCPGAEEWVLGGKSGPGGGLGT